MTTVCLTVDVEDWYDGMSELGHDLPAPPSTASGLETLSRVLSATSGGSDRARLTLFVVGKYAGEVGTALGELADAGHELASHGPDHGTLPADTRRLDEWLRQGREELEQRFQRPVTGFRSPRFDLPPGMSLASYRDAIARAGFSYVSDRHLLGPSSAVVELPVLDWRRIPIGGGSYQRLVPFSLVSAMVDRSPAPTVLYYHSYDFGVTLPSVWPHPSPALLRQVVGRRRIATLFGRLLFTFGSVSCREASAAV